MKTRNFVGKILLLGVIALGAATGVVASDKEHDVIREALRRGEVLPLTKILAIATKEVPGDIVEVELESKKSGLLKYEIKVLTANGRVREIEIDARTGAVLKIEDD